MSLLQVTDLSITFRTSTTLVHAVRAVSFAVVAGERVGLVGESGSGKTTTALALMRMIRPPGEISGGTAVLDGIDLLALSPAEVRRARLSRVAYVPQGAMNALNPVLSIRDQILDGLADHDALPVRAERAALVAKLLDSVDLPESVADRYPHQLSGGMRQRACIAIAMSMRPSLIIADEPTSALDVITQRQVAATLRRVQERIGCGLILIGHDMGLMAQLVDRVIVMRDGHIVDNAATKQMFANPAHPYSKMLIDSVPSLDGARASAAPDTPASTEPPLLAFRSVRKDFGGGLFGGRPKTALQRLSFQILASPPSIIAIVGQSGSGKTTLARMVLGLERPTTGEVVYRGQPLKDLRGAALTAYRREVQAVFQDPYGSFNPFYKVDHALAEPLRRFGVATTREAMLERMLWACSAVGLDGREVLGRFPHELSGGQRQRLMVARALALRPKLIVADEPVSMVDASQRLAILEEMRQLKTNFGISILYITHDLSTAYQISDMVLVLHQGRVVEAGLPEAVMKHPQHPYTQSLVAAIPWPDPNRPWADDDAGLRARWDEASQWHSTSTGFVLEAAQP